MVRNQVLEIMLCTQEQTETPAPREEQNVESANHLSQSLQPHPWPDIEIRKEEEEIKVWFQSV